MSSDPLPEQVQRRIKTTERYLTEYVRQQTGRDDLTVVINTEPLRPTKEKS